MIELCLVGALFLYCVGLYCLASSRNLIRLVIGIEILTTAAHLNFVSLSAFARPGYVDPLAHSYVILSIVIGGSVAAVALSMIVQAYRQYGTMDVTMLRRLRW